VLEPQSFLVCTALTRIIWPEMFAVPHRVLRSLDGSIDRTVLSVTNKFNDVPQASIYREGSAPFSSKTIQQLFAQYYDERL